VPFILGHRPLAGHDELCQRVELELEDTLSTASTRSPTRTSNKPHLRHSGETFGAINSEGEAYLRQLMRFASTRQAQAQEHKLEEENEEKEGARKRTLKTRKLELFTKKVSMNTPFIFVRLSRKCCVFPIFFPFATWS